MANTTRLGLYKPEGTELCDPVAAMHDQYDIIDDKATTTTVSETEPIPLFIGHEWWKPGISDEFYIWDGTEWIEVNLVPLGPPPGPSGRKAFTVASNAANFGAISSGESSSAFLPTTFEAELGGKYEISFCGSIATESSVYVLGLVTMRIASGSSVDSTGTLIHKVPAGQIQLGSNSLNKHSSFRAIWVATGTGDFTVGVFCRKEAGFGSNTISFKGGVYHALSVEEVLT